jgi:hypothetical protein
VEDLFIVKFPSEPACNFGKRILEEGQRQRLRKLSSESKKIGCVVQ